MLTNKIFNASALVRHISIRHPQLGSLVNYYFPINIEKARTYIMYHGDNFG